MSTILQCYGTLPVSRISASHPVFRLTPSVKVLPSAKYLGQRETGSGLCFHGTAWLEGVSRVYAVVSLVSDRPVNIIEAFLLSTWYGDRRGQLSRNGGSIRVPFISGSEYPDELHLLLKNEVMIRRLKANVVQQLPPLRWNYYFPAVVAILVNIYIGQCIVLYLWIKSAVCSHALPYYVFASLFLLSFREPCTVVQ